MDAARRHRRSGGQRLFLGLVVLAALLSPLAIRAEAAGPTVLTATAVADTYANEGAPTSNFGSSSSLTSRGGTAAAISYLRFRVPAAPAGTTLSSAVLRVHTSTDPSAGSPSVHTVHSVADNWTESTLTWDKRLTPDATVLGSLPGGTATNSSYDISLTTSAVQPLLGSQHSFAISSTGTDSLWLWSRNFGTAASRPQLVLTFDTPPSGPSVPTGLSTQVNGNLVSVSWDAAAENGAATGYDVYRGSTATFTVADSSRVGTTSTPPLQDQPSGPGTWYYRVVAFDDDGHRTTPSASVAATVPDLSPPSTPIDLAVSTSDGAVSLHWSAATDDIGVTGYRIHRDEVGGDRSADVGTTPGQSFLESDVPDGTWRYSVVAVDAAGNASGPSDPAQVTVDTIGPTPPELSSSSSDATVSLSWPAGSDPNGISEYRVYRSAASTFVPASSQLVAETGELSAQDVPPGDGTWNYFLRAVDALGNVGAVSDASTVTVQRLSTDDTTAPTTPIGLNAAASGDNVTLTWSPSSDDVGVDHYDVYRSDTAGSPGAVVTSTTSPSYLDPAVADGTWYYSVTAVDAIGHTSGPTPQFAVVVDSSAPGAPGAPSADVSGTSVTLSWSGADATNGISRYAVIRALDASDSGLTVGSTTGTQFTDTDVPARKWTYRIVAIDTVDKVGPPSGDVAITIASAPPPTGVTATVVQTAPTTNPRPTTIPGPAMSIHQGSTSSIPSAVLITPTDPRLRFAGAADFRNGTTYPDTAFYKPTSRYPHSYSSPQAYYSVDFNTDGAAFELYFKYATTGAKYRLWVDGQPVTTLVQRFSATSTGSSYVMKFNFGTSVMRHITLDLYDVPIGGIYLPSTAQLVQVPPYAVRWAVLGDSISGGSNMNTGQSSGTWVPQVATLMGWDDDFNEALGGTGYVKAGPTVPFMTRVDPDVVAYHPQKVVVFGGFNDSDQPQATIRSRADAVLAELKSKLPTSDIYIIGCWSPTGSPGSLLIQTDNTLRAAALAAGLPFISPITGNVYDGTGHLVMAGSGTWITGTGKVGSPKGNGNADTFIGTDGVHPTDAGHFYLAGRISDALRVLQRTVPTGVGLQWDAAPGAASYDVYRSTGSVDPATAVLVGNTTDTTLLDQDVPAGVWHYAVVSRGPDDAPSDPSDAATITVPDVQGPSAPTDVQVQRSGGQVTLAWTAADDDGSILGYEIHREPTFPMDLSAATTVGAVTTTSFTEPAPQGAWNYVVVAVDSAGHRSVASSPASIDVSDGTPPSVPVVHASVSGTTVTLTWPASTDNVGTTGYDVYRSSASGFTPSASNQLDTTSSPTYADLAVPTGTWHYRVVAFDAAGNRSAPSADVAAAVGVAATTSTVVPTEDSYANEGAPATNYGKSWSLSSRGQLGAISYLRFTLPAAPAGKSLSGATLRIHTTSEADAGSADPQVIQIAGDSWTQSGLTWSNRPAVAGAQLGQITGASKTNTAYTSSSLATSALGPLLGSTVSIAILSSGSDALWFWSHEDSTASLRPTLTLTFT